MRPSQSRAGIPNPNIGVTLVGVSCNEVRDPHPQSRALRPSPVNPSGPHPHHQALHIPILWMSS